ncbi:unnamed protein product [Cuscuta epithymum]|uniref:EF-hand domain-containing protein n=1 Tax=Cuscuta epithymum TaxID=186058 RepID=A0AAV0GF24_9ASTE|nr:unnamed protein product [Cuscuta epithymum]
MSAWWSALRRSRPSLRSTFLHSHSRRPPTSLPRQPLFRASADLNSNPTADDASSLLKWASGISTAFALSLVVFSKSSPSVSFSDCATPDPAVTATAPAAPQSSIDNRRPKFLFGDAFRRKVFFNYEKRIRMRSPPEKVFEYFASFRGKDGMTFMTPADLMRAVVPVFPSSESNLVRDGYLRGERGPGELHCSPSEFFMLFDTNSDGLISFKEYIFFVTLLSIPEASFSVAFKMFDHDGNGAIDLAEFKHVMALMQAHNRQGAHHSDGLRAGQNLGGHVENGGLFKYLFGEDGKQQLQHDKFVQFLRNLHEEVIRLEFAHYDFKSQGAISAKDFALSMVASADLSHLGKLLRRVDHMDNNPQLCNLRVSFDEFKSFAELRRHLLPFSVALFSYGKVNGLLTRTDFKRAASQVCGVALTDNVIDIIFHVFDTNGDGSLSSDELLRVIQKRETDAAHPTEAGFLNWIFCFFNCTRNCRDKISLLTSA